MPRRDRWGDSCEKCAEGTYQEVSFWDSADGVLHCDACKDRVARYINEDNDEPRQRS